MHHARTAGCNADVSFAVLHSRSQL